MGISLVPYEEILVKDLPSIRYLLEMADTTEFIDRGRAKIDEYETKLYIKLKNDYIGFISPRKMSEDEVKYFSETTGSDLTNGWRISPIFVNPDYQGMGIGRNALKLFYKDKVGVLWIDDDNLASQKMAKYAGFKITNDNFYVKI